MPSTRSSLDLSQTKLSFSQRKTRRALVNLDDVKHSRSLPVSRSKSKSKATSKTEFVGVPKKSSDWETKEQSPASILNFNETKVSSICGSPLKVKESNAVLTASTTLSSSSLIKESLRTGTSSPPRSPCKTRIKERISGSPRKRLFVDENSERENLLSSQIKDGSPTKLSKLSNANSQHDSHKSTSRLCLGQQNGSCYKEIRQNLHTSLPDRLLSRDKEVSIIRVFLDSSLQKKKAGSLYISGAPGTGKSACLKHLLENCAEEFQSSFQLIWVNCMGLKLSQNIYQKIASELPNCSEKPTKKESQEFIEKYFIGKGSMMVLVLDEIDQLESKNQEILYKIFELPALSSSRLILIGIANALDLTDRVLPRLQGKSKCQPKLLQFPPYTKDQIAEILTDRLKDVNQDLIDPNAIQFCARKVAAVAGDMRKAIDIMRRAVELVETETRKQQILKPVSCSSLINSPEKAASERQPIRKKVTITHVASVVSDVYGNKLTKNSSQESFPLQQKVLICTLLMMLKQQKIKEIALGKLLETYTAICKSRHLNVVNQGEFISLCQLLETRGIFNIKKGKQLIVSKISLRLQESDVDHALQDKILLSSILEAGLPRKN